jgi:hypothetical protein
LVFGVLVGLGVVLVLVTDGVVEAFGLDEWPGAGDGLAGNVPDGDLCTRPGG